MNDNIHHSIPYNTVKDEGLTHKTTYASNDFLSQVSELSLSQSLSTIPSKKSTDILLESATYCDKTSGLLNEPQGKQSKWWGFYYEHTNQEQDPKADEWPKCRGCMKNITIGTSKLTGPLKNNASRCIGC